MMGAFGRRLRPKKPEHVRPAPAFERWGTIVTARPWLSIAGGVLTVGILAWHRARRREGRPQIPYGVAIAFGGLAILTQRFLNQFV